MRKQINRNNNRFLAGEVAPEIPTIKDFKVLDIAINPISLRKVIIVSIRENSKENEFLDFWYMPFDFAPVRKVEILQPEINSAIDRIIYLFTRPNGKQVISNKSEYKLFCMDKISFNRGFIKA